MELMECLIRMETLNPIKLQICNSETFEIPEAKINFLLMKDIR